MIIIDTDVFYWNISAAEAAAAITHRSVRAAQNNPAGAARHGAQTLRSKRRNKSKLEQSSPENEVYFFSFLSHQGSLLFFFGFYKKKRRRASGVKCIRSLQLFPPLFHLPTARLSRAASLLSLWWMSGRLSERLRGDSTLPLAAIHTSPQQERDGEEETKKRERGGKEGKKIKEKHDRQKQKDGRRSRDAESGGASCSSLITSVCSLFMCTFA